MKTKISALKKSHLEMRMKNMKILPVYCLEADTEIFTKMKKICCFVFLFFSFTLTRGCKVFCFKRRFIFLCWTKSHQINITNHVYINKTMQNKFV